MPARAPFLTDPALAWLALALLLSCTLAQAQPAVAKASAAGDAALTALPIVLQAREITGRPDLDFAADGDVEFSRGDLTIQADRLSYEVSQDLAVARGAVRIRRGGARYSGSELSLRVQRFEGSFLDPRFSFDELGVNGRADRIDFLGPSRLRALNAQYTSCPRDGSGDPDWVLEADRVRLDLEANEGIADGARLRFLGLPILVLPTLSFPVTDARKSGWLPPSLNLDNRSGIELSAPYYWNIAPNRDATLAPRLSTRRGLALEGEFRWLERRHEGLLAADWLPDDRVARRQRHALQLQTDAALAKGLRLHADLIRVSDDDWWKDFPRSRQHVIPRLLPLSVLLERPLLLGAGDVLAYLRVQRWQVLQDPAAPIVAPYDRSPQMGLRAALRVPQGMTLALQTELNHFVLPDGATQTTRPEGWRWHATGMLSRPWREPGWWVVPRLTLNSAAYRTEQPMSDGRRSASRTIPTVALDAGLELERSTTGFGRVLRQTLEPRLLYVHTPYRDQSMLPNFDAAAKDFNFVSIYSDNAFSGIDRVSDAHQITAGVTSRVVDAQNGAEVLRLGLVQRYLLDDQLITPEGTPLTQRLSDLLLLGSTSVVPRWTLDAALQYSPDISRPVRSILGARYSPGPFRTLAATYRLARGSTEQLELGWQWPVYRSEGTAAGQRCQRTWYSVGRVSYSLKDSRITDSIAGFEVDAGCWIARFVAERQSTGTAEATTRLLLQLELVGLSRIGSNPLKVLKENIPGYRLLRDERGTSPGSPPPVTP